MALPNTRATAASARPHDADSEAPSVDVDALVAAVVICLHRCGFLSPPPPVKAGMAAPALLQGRQQRRCWRCRQKIGPLTCSALLSHNNSRGWRTSTNSSTCRRPSALGSGRKYEVQVIGETSGSPPEHQAWYWGPEKGLAHELRAAQRSDSGPQPPSPKCRGQPSSYHRCHTR